MAKSEETVTPGPGRCRRHVDKGLKPNAIGFWDGLAIGLDSTAPAYSLAAVLGSLVAIAGTQAPAIMLVSFVPIFLIAGAFFYMNRADQDCGTTFSWVTRAMGPTLGWLGGWAVFTTGVLVIGSLADVAALYTFELFGLTALSESRPAVVIFAVVIILVMTWLCVIGTELSAKVQRVLVLAQVAILLIFVVVALVQLATGNAPEGAVTPEMSWLSPVGLDSTSLISGVLLAVFIYWGWESAVNLTEESTDSATSPGKAGLVSTLILLVTYVGVAIAMIAVSDRNWSPSTTTTPRCSVPSAKSCSDRWRSCWCSPSSPPAWPPPRPRSCPRRGPRSPWPSPGRSPSRSPRCTRSSAPPRSAPG